jgi:sporulation protein YlmC with PRC-barrel domain
LTKKQIEESPALASDKPVSRQYEEDYYGYFGWPMYLSGPYRWGSYPTIERERKKWTTSAPGQKAWDAHLRSTRDVTGHHIVSVDGGEIGHVEDFIIDDDFWAIRYLVVDTKNWLPGKRVLIAPKWIDRVSWTESKVFINLSREAVQKSPEFTDISRVSRDYEVGLYRHYDRYGYWLEDLVTV